MKWLSALLTLFFVLGYPACHCPDFYLISGIDKMLFYHPVHQTYIEEGEITTDTLNMRLVIKIDGFANASSLDVGFMPTADAFSSDCFTPLVNSIASITFRSDADFNDIQAGSSINSKLFNTDYQVSVDSLPQVLGIGGSYDFELNFRIAEKPEKTDHRFSIVIVDNAGNQMIYTAPLLRWL